MNPIEKVWPVVAKNVSNRGPFTQDELKEYVIAEWDKLMRTKVVERLIDGVQRRCDDVIKAKGVIV